MKVIRLAVPWLAGPFAAARALASDKDVFRRLEEEATAAHFDRLRSGNVETVETSALHLYALRDFKRVSGHLIEASAYPILKKHGVLLPNRLRVAEPRSRSGLRFVAVLCQTNSSAVLNAATVEGEGGHGVRHRLLIIFAMMGSFATLTFAQPPVAGAPSQSRPTGYLTPGEFDVTHVIEPAPRRGDPRYKTDRQIFRQTRKLLGTPRYTLATNDAATTPASMLKNFSCAAGIQLTPENAPLLLKVVRRAAADTGAQSGKAKDYYQRMRPYVIDKGTICQAPAELMDRRLNKPSYDYPSGHTTLGWTYALVLASAVPERAQAILERGRAYGESRFICGAHNESAVEAGMLSTSATMALVQTKPDYRADLDAARDELATLRVKGTPASGGCAEEASLIAQRVMPRLSGDRAQ